MSFSSIAAEKILWSPPFQDLPSASDLLDGQPPLGTPITPCTFTFPDGILSEVQAATSYAFSHAAQMASLNPQGSPLNGDEKQGAKSLREPIISLYYPHAGCHEIIDSMVKSLALAQGADIVVLDSLELALEEFGAFGKGGFSASKHQCSFIIINFRGSASHQYVI